MKPTRLLLIWLATLLGLSIVQGALRALGIDPGPSLQAINWALLLALLVLALLDAAHLLRRPSPSIERRLSGSLALGRWAEVQVSVQHDYRQPLTVELFDHVPDGLSFEQLPHSLELQPGQTSQFSYRLRPLRRGHFSFQQCEINLPGPLGLWSARRYLKVNDSTRVYPDFAHLYGAQLLAVDSWISQLGVRQRQRRGQGLEFHQLREFREGDSLRQIDWKATARQRTPIAREYQDERDQQIIFMLDCGQHMRSQDGELSHFDHALNACLLLSYIALRQGDAVGLMTFASHQPRYLPPVKGLGQLKSLLNASYDLESCNRSADYQAAAVELLKKEKRQTLVIILTNLRNEDNEDLTLAINHLRKQHLVLVTSLRENILEKLLARPVNTRQEALDYCAASDYLHTRMTTHAKLKLQGIPVVDTQPEKLGASLTSKYLNWKKSGAL